MCAGRLLQSPHAHYKVPQGSQHLGGLWRAHKRVSSRPACLGLRMECHESLPRSL